jgi:hypothetical protein
MSDHKRQILFDVYSENLFLLRQHALIPPFETKFEKPFICPICLNEFTQEHLNTKLEQHLTLEDAPPKSLGGKANVLTCKKCNNTCGHEVDAHLAKRIKELDKTKFFNNSEAQAKVMKDGVQVNGTIIVDEKGIMKMFHSIENNNPVVLKKFINSVKKNTVIDFTFMPSKTNDDRLKLALLKTGYLLLFQKFGYSLILGKEYDRIRTQLQYPNELIYPLDFWFLGPFPKELTKNVPFVIEPGLGSILPFFELTTGKTNYIFATILPINDRPVEQVIEGFKKKFNETSEFNISMHKFNSETDFLTNMENAAELLAFVKTIE